MSGVPVQSLAMGEFRDGRHDFDWIPGVWKAHQRKLVDVLDPQCTEWVEFDSTVIAHGLLFGLGNTDRLLVDALPPHGTAYEGMTLRLYEPDERLWRIWWSSSRFPGRLDPPVEGRFEDGVGVFYGDDDLGGRPMRVRLRWSEITSDSARWDQAFSYDGGDTWEQNWYALFTRLSH